LLKRVCSDSEGRAYYDAKLATGKTNREALRAPPSRLSRDERRSAVMSARAR
jgi:hypothetical protein